MTLSWCLSAGHSARNASPGEALCIGLFFIALASLGWLFGRKDDDARRWLLAASTSVFGLCGLVTVVMSIVSLARGC